MLGCWEEQVGGVRRCHTLQRSCGWPRSTEVEYGSSLPPTTRPYSVHCWPVAWLQCRCPTKTKDWGSRAAGDPGPLTWGRRRGGIVGGANARPLRTGGSLGGARALRQGWEAGGGSPARLHDRTRRC